MNARTSHHPQGNTVCRSDTRFLQIIHQGVISRVSFDVALTCANTSNMRGGRKNRINSNDLSRNNCNWRPSPICGKWLLNLEDCQSRQEGYSRHAHFTEYNFRDDLTRTCWLGVAGWGDISLRRTASRKWSQLVKWRERGELSRS